VNEIATVLVDQLERFSISSKSPARLHVVGLRDEELDALRRDHIEIDGETESALATEWEWDVVPELFLVVTDSINAAFDLCNRYSPQFVVSVLTADAAEHESAWHVLNAPFVGNGFTRWVDGQYALGRPELGLSNWQSGRALGRGGILSGDDIRTFRYRMHQSDPTIHR
jgi:glutamate-5-semialdehyde dehydrogenase